MSRRISLRSTIFTGGMRMPSSKASRADGQKLPGVMPPMSYWCRQLVTQQNSSPFEHRAQQHHVHLVRCADPGALGEEHVAAADARVAAATLHRPLALRVADAPHTLHF